MKNLQSPIWNSIGAVAAVISIILAILLWWNQREIYELQLVVLANTSLVEVEDDFQDQIEVLYRGEAVNNLSLVQVRLENSGNQPVVATDYESPITLIFPEGSHVIEGSVTESFPENISVEAELSRNRATFEPILLNSQDRVILRFLVVNIPANSNLQNFQVNARVKNTDSVNIVNSIEQAPTNSSSIVNTFAGGFFAAFIGALLAALSGFAYNLFIQWTKVISSVDDSNE